MLLLTTIMVLEFALMGGIYNGLADTQNSSTELTVSDMIDTYGGRDVLVAIVSVGLALIALLPIVALLSYSPSTKRYGTIFCIFLLVSCSCAIFAMTFVYCMKESVLWSLGSVVMAIFEVTVSETASALGRAFFIKNKVF